MKVKMLTLMAGPEGTVQPGDSIEVKDEEAAGLISGGFAVPLDGEVINATVGSDIGGSAPVRRRSKKVSKTSA